MSLIAFILVLALQGLIIGAFARLALPGKDPLSIPETIAVGLAGSFIAGLLVYAISDGSAAPGFLASLVFSALILYFIRRRRGGGLVDPGGATPGHAARALARRRAAARRRPRRCSARSRRGPRRGGRGRGALELPGVVVAVPDGDLALGQRRGDLVGGAARRR